ncbi:copine-8-like isoform X2 [Tubulanus polymorphus]|uniref:copine-8-like isoform X2 n=1 Tax=Tubulanus polymorphus TaxID=672921 RepID=UPI003DA2CF96
MQQPFHPGAATAPSSQVEVSISCRNLMDKDVFSKSDPLVVVYMKAFGSERYSEIGRTESIQNTLNPDFVKKFILDYFFEECQKLRFDVYDKDDPSAHLDRQDFLGSMECTLGQVVGSAGGRFTARLTGASRSNRGQITVSAEEISSLKDVAVLQFCAKHLDKKDFLGKSDPFLVFHRSNPDNTWTVVHKTEVIKNTLDPTWRPFSVPVRKLCNGDYDRLIKVDCFDWDSDGSHDLIGIFQVSLTQLVKGGASNTYECINPKKKAKKKNYKNSGTVSLMSCRIEKDYTFLDFVAGGMQINFTVAIDFTASNGQPNTPSSLHYINSNQPNQYATALYAVGEIIQDYDSDKMFPALGFGARLPPDGRVSHEFFLNGHPTNPYCEGLNGLMAAYHRSVHNVQLYGPTNFTPVIDHVAKFAAAAVDGSNYFILLILTDGVITDYDQTKMAIIKASRLPMSIIIVGVGNAEFEAMEDLDADNKRLHYNGHYAERDIVQFVPFRDFMTKYGSLSKAYLAKEVLAEVPNQVTQYMKMRGIKPHPPPPAREIPELPPDEVIPPQMAPPPRNDSLGRSSPSTGASAPYPSHGAPIQGTTPYPGQAGHPGGAPYPASGGSPYHHGGQMPPGGSPYHQSGPGYPPAQGGQMHPGVSPYGHSGPGYPPAGGPGYPPAQGGPGYPPAGGPGYPPPGGAGYPPAGGPGYPNQGKQTSI